MADYARYVQSTIAGQIQVWIRASETTVGAKHTLTIEKVMVNASFTPNNSSAYITVDVTYGGTTLASGKQLYVNDDKANDSVTIDVSSDTTKSHVTQTKELKLKVTKLRAYNYSSSETFNGSASTTISIGARPSYSVSYNANSGSGAPSSQTKWYDETLKLAETKPSKPSYVFRRWNTNTSDTGTAYNPGANYTGNAALTLYAIWNPIISYNGNGGANVPASQTKTYGTNLTLSGTVPTRTGYQFTGWNTKADGTGTTYQPGGTYTQNVAVTLYAIWKRVAQAPTISSISAVRCTATGTPSDMGTYCLVTAQWSVDTSGDAGMSANQGTVSGTIAAGGTSRAITFSSGTSGTSGTATAIVPNCDTDTQYIVTVTVRNTVIGAGNTSLLSTSRSDILTMAFFTMDFAAGGRGIGMGVAAPRDGIELGLSVQLDDDLTVLGDLVAPNLTMTSETDSAVASAASGTNWGVKSGTYGYRYGPFSFVSLCVASTTALVAGTQYTVASVTSKYRPIRDVGFANQYGHGVITSGGTVYFRPTVAVGANTSMYVGAMCVAGS